MHSQDIIDELKSEIASQKNEIARLKSDLAKLNGMCESESKDVTDHIKYIYKYLKMLDDRSVADLNLVAETMTVLRDAISPMEEKIFPGVAKAREQLAAIAANREFVTEGKNKKRP
jgi:septal ring factor EnvC (AmiA/AmiB activator)